MKCSYNTRTGTCNIRKEYKINVHELQNNAAYEDMAIGYEKPLVNYVEPHLFKDMCTPLAPVAFLNVEITVTDFVTKLL